MLGLKNWRRRRLLQRTDIPQEQWAAALRRLPLLRRLTADEQRRLRELVVVFLHEKQFSGALGLEVSESMRLLIAVQACLLILNLDMEYYAGWSSVIVYPSLFRPRRSYTDAAGVVHENSRVLSGEAWSHGPMILSWDEVEQVLGEEHTGGNVVVHEFAHKLDMLNGSPNGLPPLHKDMNRQSWTEDFAAAYKLLRIQLAAGEPPAVNPYAAESPAEFFAVLSEAFFMEPDKLQAGFPQVYAQLQNFYRQDPAWRRGMLRWSGNVVQARFG